MAVKLRLVRMGKPKQPTYRVVAADSRSPRNGRFIEILGTYEPRAGQGRAAHRDGGKAAAHLGRRRERMTDRGNDLDELDDDLDDDFGNRVEGGTARAVLAYIARAIVDEPDAVVVEAEERRGGVMLRLHVAPDDLGRVIGRRGRVAQAIRAVVRAAGSRDGIDAAVDIVD